MHKPVVPARRLISPLRPPPPTTGPPRRHSPHVSPRRTLQQQHQQQRQHQHHQPHGSQLLQHRPEQPGFDSASSDIDINLGSGQEGGAGAGAGANNDLLPLSTQQSRWVDNNVADNPGVLLSSPDTDDGTGGVGTTSYF